jgi:hypothetical protein
MDEAMDIFKTEVSENSGMITVYYLYPGTSGSCTYERCQIRGKVKSFKRNVEILISTDMEDIIECLYQLGHIMGAEDLQKINYIIKTHSRKVLDDYLKEL